MSALIIGNGLVGQGLASLFNQKGMDFTIASRNSKITFGNHVKLDLENLSNFEIPFSADVAYFCAAITKKEECEKNKNRCKLINVTNTNILIEKLLDHGIHVVFLSSAEVFDGEMTFYKTTDCKNPISTYGKYKSEVEETFSGKSVAIIRLSKIFSRSSGLLEFWKESILEGKQVEAFANAHIAPISLQYACGNIFNIGQERGKGVFHLSGDRDITYYEFAKEFAKKLNRSIDLITSIESKSYMPKYSSLKIDRNLQNQKILPQTLDSFFEDLL